MNDDAERAALIEELVATGATVNVCGTNGRPLALASLRELVDFAKQLAAKTADRGGDSEYKQSLKFNTDYIGTFDNVVRGGGRVEPFPTPRFPDGEKEYEQAQRTSEDMLIELHREIGNQPKTRSARLYQLHHEIADHIEALRAQVAAGVRDA